MTDFDEELTMTLRERAVAVPPRPDLAGAAIRQAHGIRRRRRMAGGVAAAALVAIAVPVGLQAGDALSRGNSPTPPPATQLPDNDEDSSEITPSQVTVQLPQLRAGDAPAIPYVDGSRLIVDGPSLDLGADAVDIAQVAYAGGTAYYALRDEGGNLTIKDTATGSGPRPIDAGPWASPDGEYVAVLADGALEVTADGAVSTVPVSADYVQSLTFAGDAVFFVAGNDPTLMRWGIGDAQATAVGGVARATAVSGDGELVADMYEVDNLKAEACTRLKSLATREVLWQTCEFEILGFSPDGSYVWGVPAFEDGYGKTANVVLDAQTGEVLMRVDGPDPRKNPQLQLTQTVFENDTSLLITMEQGEQGAIVRCDLVSGGCERATELADGVVPFEGGSPYRLLS